MAPVAPHAQRAWKAFMHELQLTFSQAKAAQMNVLSAAYMLSYGRKRRR